MDCDYSIELGPPSEEATLEFPWSSGEASGPAYVDLKQHPELLALIGEAVAYPELGEFLKAVNSPRSPFATAKCDVWSTGEIEPAEEIYGCAWKLGSYVDLVFDQRRAAERFSFFHHEDLARTLTELLKKAPDISASCEIIVRRCYYHQAPPHPTAPEPGTVGTPDDCGNSIPSAATDEPRLRPGFYFTLYVIGYGEDETAARQRWQMALKLVAAALLQLVVGR